MSRGLSRFKTLRVRICLAVVLVFGIALGVGVTAMVLTVRSSLESDLDATLKARAQDLVSILAEGASPSSLTITDQDDVFIQVTDASGRVVASTRNVRRLPPLLAPGEGRRGTVTDLPGEVGDRFRVMSLSAHTPRGSLEVVVGRNLDTVQETTSVLLRTLLLGSFVFLLAVAAASWIIVRRALGPVEAIRSQVASISATELDRRVPEQPGRDEVALLAATMNAMLERLEDAQLRERRFVSDASHELRSPIASIRQQAEVALSHGDRVSTTELAGGVLAESSRLERLVDDLLTLARLSEPSLPSRTRPVDLDDLMLEEARRLRTGAGVRIDAGAVSGARTTGDPAQLQRLVRNLADNAARHAKSVVTFGLNEVEDTAVMTIDDDGPGVPEEDREQIFQRFARLDDARARDFGGVGLGLAIVAGIADAHRGTVTVTGSPLGGARFEVRLPLLRA
jgi:signal transduction histidine kinase